MVTRLAILGGAVLLMAAGPIAVGPVAVGPVAVGQVAVGPVTLRPQPGSALDATARQVAAADLADGDAHTLLLVGSQSLGAAGTGPALFVEVQSPRSCGSAGCSVSVYVPTGRTWAKVLDAVSGSLVVAPTVHRGMHDLVVGKGDRWVWNGKAYADTLPAPQVDLRPRKRPARPMRHG